MEVNNIITVVKNKNNVTPTRFYNSCLEKLSELEDKIIYNIPEDKHILESVRLYLVNTDHDIYVADTSILEPKMIHRTFDLNEKAKNNLLHQIYAINAQKVQGLCEDHNIDIDDVCCIISKDKISGIKVRDRYAGLGLLLGVESLRILDHQNLNRFCSYVNLDETALRMPKKIYLSEGMLRDIKRDVMVKKRYQWGEFTKEDKKRDISNSTKMFANFYQYHKMLDIETKERLLVISGAILHVLGTTYTEDIDIYYYGEGEPQSKISNFEEEIKKEEKHEYTIIYDNAIIQRTKPKGYVYKWATELWPKLAGKDHLVEVMADPEYHFYFMGIQMMGTKMIIERLLQRASPSAFVDLIMLNRINGLKSEPCFPNLTIRQGKIMIYDDNMINRKLRTVKNYFRYWHNLKYDLDKLHQLVPRCDELPHHIYKKIPEKNKYTSLITYYNNSTMKHYIKKYLGKEKILDIGAGRLRDMIYYNKIGIKHLVAIEPSDASLKEGRDIHKKYRMHIRLNTIQGYGDEVWNGNEKYKVVLDNKPYNSILMKFTIHYMIKNLNILLDNLKSVDGDNTTIVISCLDGNLIDKKLEEHGGRYEMFIGDEPLYGIYRMKRDGEYSKIMVYFKGVYGVEKGSIEYLVDTNLLIKSFNAIGYQVVENTSLVDVDVPYLNKIKSKFNDAQRKVSELHKVIVFKKSKHGGYYEKYMKYKIKYKRLKENMGVVM